MTLPTTYSVGTASVNAGDTTVVITNGNWGEDTVMSGDFFCVPSQPLIPQQRIISVEYDDTLQKWTGELWASWPGTNVVDAAYEVRYTGIIERSTAQSRKVLEEMGVVQANGRGLFYRYSDTILDEDPGPGYLRLNNLDLTAVTAAYIDVLDANGATVSGVIDTWDDSSSFRRGTLSLRSLADPSAFRSYAITGTVVDGTGYRKLTLTHIGGSGSFGVNSELMVSFSETGDAGESYETNATVEDPSELAALEGQSLGYLVFVTDLQTEFGPYEGISGVVELIAGPDWKLVARYTGDRGDVGPYPEIEAVVTQTPLGSTPDVTVSPITGGFQLDFEIPVVRGSGIQMEFSTTVTDADPGAGFWRANNAAFASATQLFISKTSDVGGDIAAFLTTLGVSTSPNKGTLVMQRLTDGVTASWNVTGVTDATGYVKVAVSGYAGPAVFANAAISMMQFQRTGNAGAGNISTLVAGLDIEIDASVSTTPVIGLSRDPGSNLNLSVSLTALQVADNSNAALFLGNGVADHFDALTYVDVAGATNLSTSTAGVLKPTTGSDTFASSGSLGLTTDTTLYGGYSTRERIPVGVITGDGNAIRLTLRPPTSGNNTPLDDVWLGHAGTGANFDGSQVRVTFGGATGVTLVAGGGVVVSDLIPYAFDDAKDLIVALDFGATADVRSRTSLTGYTSYQKAATSGESGNTTVSGYTANSNMIVVIDTIEVRTATGVTNNMAVLSTGLTAYAEPTSMRALLLVKEVSESTPGTDYTFKCSRDNGGSLYSMVLTELFMLPNGIRVIEASNLDMTGGTSGVVPRWRFDTLNNKNVELHGVHFHWQSGESP